MKNILIFGPDNLYSFPRQVGDLMRSRVTNTNGKEIEISDLDFAGDELRNEDGYSHEELSELPFDDAIKIFKAIIRKILSTPDLNEEKRNDLNELLSNAPNDPKNDTAANEYDFNVFNQAVENLPENCPIKISEATRKDPENIKIYKNGKPNLKGLESGSYVAVDAHGTTKIAGGIWITNKGKETEQNIHPSNLLNDVTNENHEEPIILDVYACYAGAKVVGENNKKGEEVSSGGYSNIPTNTAIILNCDDGDILMSFEKYLLNNLQEERQKLDLSDPFSMFLFKIFQSPNTCKFIYKDNGGETHIYENEFLPSEISNQNISDKMQSFINWCEKKKIGDIEKLNELSHTLQKDRLTDDYLKDFGNMAAALSAYRGNIEAAEQYKKEGYDFIRVPLPESVTEKEKRRAIQVSNSLSVADHLDNFYAYKNGTGFTTKMASDKRKEKEEYYREAAIYNIEQGIIPNFVNSRGLPLLLLAVFCDDPEIVNILLERGADPMRMNKKNNRKILPVALFRGNVKIIEALVSSKNFNMPSEELRDMIKGQSKADGTKYSDAQIYQIMAKCNTPRKEMRPKPGKIEIPSAFQNENNTKNL